MLVELKIKYDIIVKNTKTYNEFHTWFIVRRKNKNYPFLIRDNTDQKIISNFAIY